MLMMNSFLSTPITIFPDGLFIYKKQAAKLCGIYHYLRRIKIADQHKSSPETLLAGQFDGNETSG